MLLLSTSSRPFSLESVQFPSVASASSDGGQIVASIERLIIDLVEINKSATNPFANPKDARMARTKFTYELLEFISSGACRVKNDFMPIVNCLGWDSGLRIVRLMVPLFTLRAMPPGTATDDFGLV